MLFCAHYIYCELVKQEILMLEFNADREVNDIKAVLQQV
jgi:hypothetical protein